ncbi:ABC transporter ATP-binding protein [Burkholderia mayonis]|uniref:ABC transporter ATP-binding protein n=1 Tax=Burkholderia mayonis TaxID=1385591 RepID=UPI001CF7DA42|nr:ABC transporter ATP-binding protein [Burkholderia mayonis]
MVSSSITARDISVEFPIYENSHRSLKKTVLNLTTGGRIGQDSGRHAIVQALSSLSFTFEHGERVGLVGHNGSGKTTLLRTLSGVYAPVRGELKVQGKIASLLDVSMGLDPDATGFENIYLRGILDGLKPANIRSKIDEIADFSELGDYLNLPVRTYSSGMMLRLAFAISTSVEADILIMDEWLSVGDAEFSQKAAKRIEALVGQASILVLASHDPDLVARVCTRKISMEHGHIVADEPVIRPEQAGDTPGADSPAADALPADAPRIDRPAHAPH